MKNFKKIFALISVAAIATVGFAACDDGNPNNVPPEHTHAYSSEWAYNETNHWHNATCEHSWLKSDEKAHSFTEKKEGEETCTEGALITRTCSCGYSYTYTSEPLGHSFEDKEGKEPSCKEPGYTDYRECTRCHQIVGKNDILQTQHNYHYEAVTEDADGNEIDKHHEVCGFCNEEKAGSLKDHTYKSVVIVDEEGKHTGKHHDVCPLCGAEKKDSTAAHSFDKKLYGHDDTNHWYLCDACGEPDATKTAHSYDPVTGLCVCGAMEPDHKDYFTYEENGETLTVTGLVDQLDGKTGFSVPATHDGKAVTAVANGAFAGNTFLTEIVLPASVTTIGDYAFQRCTALKTVVMPGVTKLGTFDGQVFNGCSALQEITLPAGVTSIGANMFMNCKELATVTAEGAITKIDTQAFYGCTKLNGISLTGELTYIGQRAFAKSGIKTLEVAIAQNGRIAQGAFEDCSELTALSITGSVSYFASPVLSGCTKLQTLTLPFIGDNLEAAQATDTHFGYIFGKTESGYAIPSTLETLNIKGGSVQRGALDGCKTLTVNADKSVDVQTKTFKDYTGTFNWEGTLPGPSVTAASVDHESVFVGENVVLSYTVTPDYDDVEVSVTVKKDGQPATLTTDYTVNEKTYTFNNAGTYTLTVTATYNGITVTKDVTVTVDVHGPSLSDVTMTGGITDTVCAIDTEVTLVFTYEGDGETTITYTVTKEGQPANADSDYTLDQDGKKITFKVAGTYTVEVKAERNGKTETKSITITAADPKASAPTINNFTASKTDLTEGNEAITLTADVTYVDGDSNGSTTYKVEYQKSDAFENADPDYYTLNDNSFTAKVAGTYKITVTIVTKLGGTATGSVDITVNPVELELALTGEEPVNGWIRVKKGEDKNVAYTLGAGDVYLGGYEIGYGKDIDAASIQGGDKLVTLHLDEENTVHFTVTFTHKAIADKTYTLTIPVSFVSDVASAPVLGEDPFGGTYGTLIPGTGLMLYYDVKENAQGAQLANSEVTYEVVSKAINTDKTVSIGKVNGDEKYPFVLVEDFDQGNHTTTGTVTVKLTATKDGQTAVATKVFTVRTLPDPNSNKGLNAYLDEAYPGMRGPLNPDLFMGFGHRDNMVVSKEGLFFHRAAASDWRPEGDMLCLTWDGTTSDVAFPDSFKLEFDWTILKRTGSNNKAGFNLNLRTGNWNGWVGSQFGYYIEDAQTDVSCGYWGEGQNWEGRTLPTESESIGKTIHVRMTHTLDGAQIHYLVEWDIDGDGKDYQTWLTFNVATSTKAGDMGTPIYAMQFGYENGCYCLGNFKLTDLTQDA